MRWHVGLKVTQGSKDVHLVWFQRSLGWCNHVLLGPPVVPFYIYCWEGSPTKIDNRKKGNLFLTSLLEDLVYIMTQVSFW